MTLDEAIRHAEEVADTCEYEASKYDMNDYYESHVACQVGKCAEDHRQLAAWLKELKQLKEQESVLDKIRTEIEQRAKPNELGGRGNGKSIRYGLCIALNIIDKYKTESGAQDADNN